MENNVSMAFSAINKAIESNIPKLTQEEARGKDYVQYGENNLYPEYLHTLYEEVNTLKQVVDGVAGYVAGDDAVCNVPGFEVQVNRKGDSLRNLIKWLAKDYNLYGGCAIEVIKNAKGGIAELNYIDFRYLRTNKDNSVFWYSKEYAKKYVRSTTTLVYPKYMKDSDAPTSIMYIKNDVSSVYPIPRYSGAIKCCEIERRIDDLHLNALSNQFMGSYIINFLSGIPTPEQKDQIEKDINEKFAGTENSARILLNFSNGEENAAKVEKLDITDFSDKYKAAAERSREQIYSAFQAIPQLFGNMAASTGFNEVEFQTSWQLFNGTVVRDIQRTLGDAFDKIFGMKDSITIEPFSLNNSSNDVN